MPYPDTVGKTTIGVGRNIEDRGISEDEAMLMLDNDIKLVEMQCAIFEWFPGLSDIRKKVIIDMVFNLGITRFRKFKKTIQYLSENDFLNASIEMKDSKWCSQVGNRCVTLSYMMNFNEEEQ